MSAISPIEATPPAILVGYSGGPDSTALLYACVHLRENWHRLGDSCCLAPHIAAAHFDHGLRKGSKADADFCKLTAAEIGATFISEKMADAGKSKGGAETRAREMRIEFLKRAAAHLSAHFYGGDEPPSQTENQSPPAPCPVCVLLAHTMDDQAETVIMNLARGAGVRGAAGMPAVSFLLSYGSAGCEISGGAPPESALLIRPLLEFSKREILSLLDESGIEYLTDETNADAEYTARNKIRAEVLPALEKCYPSAAEKLARFAEIMAGTESETEERAAAFIEKYERPFCALFPGIFIPGEPRIMGDFLPKHSLRFLSPHVRARVYLDWLKGGTAWRADYAAYKNLDDSLFVDEPKNANGIFETSRDFVWQPSISGIKNDTHPMFRGEAFDLREFGESPAFFESCGELAIAIVVSSPDALDEKIEIPKIGKICGIGGTVTLREIILRGNQYALAATLAQSKTPLMFKEIDDEFHKPPGTDSKNIRLKKYYSGLGIPASIIRRLRILVDAKGRPLWHPQVSSNPAAAVIEKIGAHEKSLVFVFLGPEMRHI